MGLAIGGKDIQNGKIVDKDSVLETSWRYLLVLYLHSHLSH